MHNNVFPIVNRPGGIDKITIVHLLLSAYCVVELSIFIYSITQKMEYINPLVKSGQNLVRFRRSLVESCVCVLNSYNTDTVQNSFHFCCV